MKKSTLLAIAALVAGTQMGYADDLAGGIITSTKENPVYYTISNMRADRLSYTDGFIYDADHESTVSDRNDVQVKLPEYLPDEDPTPEIWEFPYMGLAFCENAFWTAFSAQTEVMQRDTRFWWFESAGKGKVYIRNAVIGGALKGKSEPINGRNSMGFSEMGKKAYYVIPLTEDQIESLELTDDPYGENAFALSQDSKIADNSGTPVNTSSCLDMNNYITYNWDSGVQKVDEDGEPVFKEVNKLDADGNVVKDEDGEPVKEQVPVNLEYGFAGVDRTWNPLRDNGTGNEKINNGSLFKVVKVEDIEEVNKAIEKYKEIELQSYRDRVVTTLEKSKKDIISRLETLRNLPAIYGDGSKLDAIITSIQSKTVDPSKINGIEDVDVYEEQLEQEMLGEYLRAVRVAGNGTSSPSNKCLLFATGLPLKMANSKT